MGTAATRAKQKWNEGHYTVVRAAMDPELAAGLKKRCKDEGVSVASVITGLVMGHLGTEAPPPKGKPPKKAPGSRGQRNRELWRHIVAIEEICGSEEEYMCNIPENLQGSIRYENAENSVERMLSAIEELKEAYPEGGR
ncbi:MAG: hypothetical protein FWG53_05315 [Clostridiales bacterium]|nr:hypothetical protein [Clostridiales bacterium]